MSGKPTTWANPEYTAFVKQWGPSLGFQTQALHSKFRQHFKVAAGFSAFRLFAKRVADDAGLEREAQSLPAAPDIEAAVQESREKKQREYEKSLLRDLLAEKSATDQIIAAIQNLTPRIPPAKIERLPAPKSKGQPQTALLMFSDLHVGADVREDETGGYGHYNYEIFKRRLQRLRDSIRSITQRERQNCPIDHLVIAALGDDIEGDEIFPAQSQMIDLDLMAQVLMCARDQAQFIIDLLSVFERISYFKVTGNHGRIGRKGQRKRHVNFDYLIAFMVQMQLAEYGDRVSFVIPKAPFLAIEIEGWKFILRHGDGIKSWMGLPFYGLQRSVGRWVAIQAATGDRFDYMLCGHFHQHATLPFTGIETIINGSFPGTTEFSVEVMESLATPMQWFSFVHPEQGLAARYPIWLENPTKVRAA